MNLALKKAVQHWAYIAPIVAYPSDKKSFDELVARLDELLNIVGEDENNPLIGLVNYISNIISDYESKHKFVPKTKGIDALKFLMQEHNLGQTDLSEVASQGVISEILCGKRTLNLRQIKALAKRFKVSSHTFIEA